MTPGASVLRATATDATMFAALAEIELASLAPTLPAPLVPRRLFGSTGALSIQFIDVKDSSIGAYRECTVSVLCRDPLTRTTSIEAAWCSPPGFPIWIAVTSETAREYGVSVWAYPKWAGDVAFTIEAGRFHGSASIPGLGAVFMTAAATIPAELETGGIVLRSLSARRDVLLPAYMRGHARLCSDWDPRARYSLRIPSLAPDEVQGTASSGVYAEAYSYELLPPTPVPLGSLTTTRRRTHVHE
jgi:hypothetical protein